MKRICLGLLLIFGAQQTLPLPAVIRTVGYDSGATLLTIFSTLSGLDFARNIAQSKTPNEITPFILGAFILAVACRAPKKDTAQKNESKLSRLRKLLQQYVHIASIGGASGLILIQTIKTQQ